MYTKPFVNVNVNLPPKEFYAWKKNNRDNIILLEVHQGTRGGWRSVWGLKSEEKCAMKHLYHHWLNEKEEKIFLSNWTKGAKSLENVGIFPF